MVDYITALDDETLAKTKAACEAVTVTNCAWDVYRAAQFLKNECSVELVTRSKFHPSKSHHDLTEYGFRHGSKLSE